MVEVLEVAEVEKDAHDGRFGERFDDEVSVPGILWVTAGLALVCGLGMLITWGMQSHYAARAAVQLSPVSEANERRMPEGPLLQRDPEGELEVMRHEMAERLGSYGWVNEGTGTVHMPIDKAIRLLVERGSVAAGGSAAEPLVLLVEQGSAAASGTTTAEEPSE